MLSNKRIAVVLSLFCLAALGLHAFDSVRATPIKRPLEQFPKTIGEWTQIRSRALSDSVVTMLGVADYVDYDYVAPDGLSLNLYVSYFPAVGVTGEYHSPRNCLPGGGWQIASISPLALEMPGAGKSSASINSMVVQNGGQKQLTLYWFQNRGRIIASEYWEKIYLVLDSIFKRRRDGSFVRIMAPAIEGKDQEIEARLREFAGRTAIILEDFLPGG